MRIKIGDLVIEPQASKYYFVFGAPPRKIGDFALIGVPQKSFRRAWVEYRVILLADKSGRKWLVAAP